MSNNRTPLCPECGGEIEIPTVDIGVGEQQCGPAFCLDDACGWSEPYPEEIADAE